jgi:hypothetical protein
MVVGQDVVQTQSTGWRVWRAADTAPSETGLITDPGVASTTLPSDSIHVEGWSGIQIMVYGTDAADEEADIELYAIDTESDGSGAATYHISMVWAFTAKLSTTNGVAGTLIGTDTTYYIADGIQISNGDASVAAMGGVGDVVFGGSNDTAVTGTLEVPGSLSIANVGVVPWLCTRFVGGTGPMATTNMIYRLWKNTSNAATG